jgi:hypothetical protein
MMSGTRGIPTVARVLVAMTLAASLAGCGTPSPMMLSLEVFSAEQSFVDTFKAFDSKASKLDCIMTEDGDTIYELSRYQWARLKAMALEGKAVERTLSQKQGLEASTEAVLSATTRRGETLEAEVLVVPDSCCTFVLQYVGYRLTDTAGQSRIAFACMYPIIQNILIDLPPTAAGRRRTWILMDIKETPAGAGAASH